MSYLSKYVEARRKLKDVANNYILINCGNMNVDNNDNNDGNRDDEMQMFKESIVQLMCAGADTIKRIVDASNDDEHNCRLLKYLFKTLFPAVTYPKMKQVLRGITQKYATSYSPITN